MGVDHGGVYISVPHQLLDRADVLSTLQQMGSEGVTEGMRRCWLMDAARQHGPTHGLLDQAGIEVMSTLLPTVGIAPALLLWKNPLPASFHRGVGILSG